jgi:hypothetical protein
MANTERVTIHGKGWTRTTTIEARKFEVVSKAILASLTDEPVPFSRLVEQVRRRIPDFEGSLSWYAVTCARELEVRGELVRQDKPVRYLRPAGAASKRPAAGTQARRAGPGKRAA